jgi:hypothetical protein
MSDREIEIRPPRAEDLPGVVALLFTQLREHHNQLDEAALARAAEGLFRRPQSGRHRQVRRNLRELLGGPELRAVLSRT